MNTTIRNIAALAGLASTITLAGCGQGDEKPDVIVEQPSNTIIINPPVVKPAPGNTPVVVVKPAGKPTGKIPVVAPPAMPTAKLPAPAPQPTKVVKVPPPGPRIAVAPRATKAPPAFVPIKPVPTATAVVKPAPATAASLVVKGEIVSIAKIPDINNAPYQEALLFVKYKVLSVEKGDYKEKEVLVAHWGMQKKKLLPASRFKVGETQRLSLQPLMDRRDLERIMKWSLNDFELTEYFAVKVG